MEPEANHEKTKTMAAKALQLDPELAEAHVSMAAYFSNEYDIPRAEGEFRKAIELKPSQSYLADKRHDALMCAYHFQTGLSLVEPFMGKAKYR
jgi:tetratricopeptide (TPR) repeat protein